MSGHSGVNVVDDGLVWYWDAGNGKSWPGSGTVMTDLSGTKLNATVSVVTGGAVIANAPTNYMSTASTGILNNDSHSIFFVFQLTPTVAYPAAHTPSWEKVFAFVPSGTDRSPGVWRYPGNRILHWQYDPGNLGLNAFAPAAGTFDMNVWYYVGVTKSAGILNGYINGELIQTGTGPVTKTAGVSPILILDSITTDLAKMALCQVYSRPLTADEVKQNFAALRGRFAL